jgi:hypothetical protein
MHVLTFLLLLALLSGIILFPQFFNTLTLFRVPAKARSDADRIVPVAVISLLVFASFFFEELTTSGHLRPLRSNLHGVTLIVVDLFLSVFGWVACVKPIWILSRLVPGLKGVVGGGTIDEQVAFRLSLISRLCGIALLFVAAFLARPFLASSF